MVLNQKLFKDILKNKLLQKKIKINLRKKKNSRKTFFSKTKNF